MLSLCLLLTVPTASVDFERDVRPILNEHCVGCHGGVKQAGGVSFVWEDQVLPPDGWAVIPGEPDESPLFTRLSETDPDVRMPPPEEHPEPLSDDDRETIRRWIADGAQWSEHWSLVAPEEPPVPQVAAATPVDAFIQRRLDAEQVAPSEAAPADRWLRRVTLDLTGLLPTPADRERFLADVDDRGQAAYAAAVDDARTGRTAAQSGRPGTPRRRLPRLGSSRGLPSLA